MPSYLSLNIEGIAEVKRALDSVGGIDRYRGQLNALIHGRMKMQVRRTFDRQADPVTGQAWKPVQPFGHGLDPSHKILQSNAGAGLIGALHAAPLEVNGDEVSLSPPDSIPYANIHQWGGTIRPSKAKNLAIPMNREAQLAGSARRWWEQKKNSNRKPFVYRAKTGKKNLFLAVADENGKLELHWLLKKFVIIPQRRYFGWGQNEINEVKNDCTKLIMARARKAGFDAKEGGA